jgi:cytochrome P450
MTSDVDLTDVANYTNGVPHELFSRLRADGAVHHHRTVQLRADRPPLDFWSVVRHAEVQVANRDWETFTAADSVTIQKMPELANTLVSMGGARHTRLRRLLTAGFTPRTIGRLEEHIATRAERILDDVETQGTCDFVADVAYHLPMHVIADIVGIPDEERSWVFERTDVAMRAHSPNSSLTLDDQMTAQIELFEYAKELTDRKRRHPADDAWTLIAQAELPAEDGTVHKLEGIELEMFFVILSVAGSETTRNALSQGLVALVDHPDQLEELRDHPELVTTAADEIIRWSSPVLFFARTATRDTVLGGERISAGDRVVLWYPSANRDDRVFEDPFRFDIHRDPNPHVSFGGGGPHFCLGANLAKKEVQVLTAAVLRRFDIELLGELVWSEGGPYNNVGVSVERLPVRLTPR